MSAGAAARAPTCVPTWHGHIETTKDALMIFQACFTGTLHHCSRRPHDRERNSLIVSGNVFVYEEQTSGIKRWTDGIPWSPSRILTNFLIYRQLNSPFPPGEKKRATKRNARSTKSGEGYSTPTSSNNTPIADDQRSFPPTHSPEASMARKDDDESPERDNNSNRGLVGSLVDSYEFKEGGLLKKTMTVTVNSIQHHLVSYYSLEEAKTKLKTPREDELLKHIQPTEPLMNQTKFKFPNYDDAGDGTFENQDGGHGHYGGYYHAGASYGHYPYAAYATSSQYGHQATYAATHPHPHAAYTLPPSNAMYAPTAQHYAQHYHPGYSYHPPQAQPQYHSNYAQQYQSQPPQLQAAQPATPVKQEATPTSTPGYGGYATPVMQQQPVNSGGYGSQQSNGTTATREEESTVPTSHPAQSQNWPQQSYSHQWTGTPNRSNAQTYPYRPQG